MLPACHSLCIKLSERAASPPPPVFAQTAQPINSYWLWHTCPSKMSGSVLIFPERCSLPLSRRQGWDLYPDWLYMFIVSESCCPIAISDPIHPPPPLLLCIMATCMQPCVKETIKRPDSPVSPVIQRSNRAADLPRGPQSPSSIHA